MTTPQGAEVPEEPISQPEGPEQTQAAAAGGAGARLGRRPPGSGGRPPTGTVQPLRAAAVVVVALAVGVAVLARGGGSTVPSAATQRSTTTVPVTRTSAVVRTTTTTTLPPTTTTTMAPASVKVLVLNGWTTAHGALYFQTQLRSKGYDTLAPNDATSASIKTSEVLYAAPRYRANALAIASELLIPPSAVMEQASTNDSAVPTSLASQASVIVIIGQDISNQVPNGYS